MKNKKIKALLLVVLSSLFILIGCSGSPKIQGKWNVQDASGEQKTIEIKDKTDYQLTVDLEQSSLDLPIMTSH